MKKYDLGTLGNSIAGILGGGLGGQLLQMIMGGGAGAPASMDLGSIIASIASGGVGGGVLMAIVGMIRTAMTRKTV
jgi:hypothetical protein